MRVNVLTMMRVPALTIVLAGLTACQGGGSATVTGNPSMTNLRVEATGARTAESAPIDAGGVEFPIEEAEAYLRDLEFDLPPDLTCQDLAFEPEPPVTCGASIRVEGPYVVDLVSGTAAGASGSSLQGLIIPSGTYSRVDARFEDADPSDGLVGDTDPLADLSLRVRGTFDGPDGTTPYELRLKFNEDVRIESDLGIEVSDQGANDVIIGLDPAIWLAGVSVVTCLEDGDLDLTLGELIIDDSAGSGNCAGIENTVKENMKRSGQLDRE